MAIQSINTGTVTGSVSQTKPTTKNTIDTKDQAASAVASDDTVSIKNIPNSESSTPVIDEIRIANIKAALQSDRYKIDPERIANKMMQLDLKLPNTT